MVRPVSPRNIRRLLILASQHPLTLGGILVLVLAVTQATYLARENRAIAAEYSTLKEQVMESLILKPGSSVLAVAGFDRSGKRLSIRTDGETPSLIICLSVDCTFCEASLPSFKRLADQARQIGLQVIFVSRDYLSDVQASQMPAELTGQLVSEPTYRTYRNLALHRVPQTIVVKGGKVEAAVLGEMNVLKERQIADVIGRLRK